MLPHISSNLIADFAMLTPTYTAIAFLIAASGAHAWGVLGHATVAAIADYYLTDQAKTYVSGLLGDDVSMASVASWADEYRSTTAGKFSAPYHFIDAEDNPPTSCSVETTRDCGAGGCVVSAIANYVCWVPRSLLSPSELD